VSVSATTTTGPPAEATAAELHRSAGLDAAATAGLALYSFIACLGYARVFADWQFVGDVAVVVVVGHGLSFALRRLRVPALLAVLAIVVALVWTVAWLAYPSTFAAFVPTAETWNLMWADLGLVRDQFQEAVAPVEYVGGWSLLALIGTAFVVLSSDTFAFRAHARGEALVPGAVLFVFVAALGADRHRVALTLALVAAGFLAAALLRVRFAQTPRTVLGQARSPLSIALPAVAVAGTMVVLGAWAVGPRLPGADAEPLVETHNDGGGVTEVLSPLVDIRSRLVNRSATEMFAVRATASSYWRVSGLPEFDGRTWGLPDRSLDDVDGDLSVAAPGSTANDQEITISELAGKLVPGAAEPVAASGEGLRWNAETSTIVRIDRDLEPGDRFAVTSAMPSFTTEALRAATSTAPPDPIYLELPSDFPSSVRETAVTVTAGSATTYDAMVTMQNWFRTQFTYSLDVPQGHGNNAIEAFLRQRIGYCEQFAGTFAAMARSIGVPARVAVGFTPGVQQADGSFSVLGKNAHAWPEVWFDGLGWVAFEPTPGRGAPGAEGYTGVPAEQDDVTPSAGTGEGAGQEAAPVVTAPIPSEDEVPLPLPEIELDDVVVPTARHEIPERDVRWGVVGLVMLAVALLLLLPELVRRWRRRHPSPDLARQTSDLWDRAIGAVAATGYRVDPALTPLEQAQAVAPRLPVAARPLKSLAAVATAATFAPPDEVADLVQMQIAGEPGPRRWCRQVERIATDSMTAGGRVRRYFSVWT
jgi:transglutaminase-like putative cysteine protease